MLPLLAEPVSLRTVPCDCSLCCHAGNCQLDMALYTDYAAVYPINAVRNRALERVDTQARV